MHDVERLRRLEATKSKAKMKWSDCNQGPVHTYPEICESANFFYEYGLRPHVLLRIGLVLSLRGLFQVHVKCIPCGSSPSRYADGLQRTTAAVLDWQNYHAVGIRYTCTPGCLVNMKETRVTLC